MHILTARRQPDRCLFTRKSKAKEDAPNGVSVSRVARGAMQNVVARSFLISPLTVSEYAPRNNCDFDQILKLAIGNRHLADHGQIYYAIVVDPRVSDISPRTFLLLDISPFP